MSQPARQVPLAYFLTFSCYGTWLHGRGPGSVDGAHNQYGAPLLPPDPERLAEMRRKLAEPPFRTNHVHVIVHGEADPDKMLDDYKAYATRRLKEAGFDCQRRRRWTEGGSTRFLWKYEQVEAATRYVVREQGDPMEVFVGDEYTAIYGARSVSEGRDEIPR